MVFNQTQNTSIKNNLIDELKLNPAVDTIPSVVNPTIQPVFEVTKKNSLSAFSNAVVVSSSAATLFTTPSDRDFYLTSASLSLIKDATCDKATGSLAINATINGSTRAILSLPTLTLTAQNIAVANNFSNPIKIDRGTAIQRSTFSFTAGTAAFDATITGYTEETAIKTV